ncbi:MAG: uroporphyrinogen decarboxylase family protein [Promethearchaeota archaeon]
MHKMTHKERILSAINHEESDVLPTYAFKVEPGFIEGWEEYFEVKEESWVQFGQDQTILVELGIDGTTDPSLGDRPDPEAGFKPYIREDGCRVNANGRITKKATGGRVFYYAGAWTSLEERKKFPARVPPTEEYFEAFEKFYNQKVIKEDKIYVFPILNGFHEGIWLSIGYSAFAKELRKPTGLLEYCVDELYKVNLEICKRLLDIDDEMVIAFTDDIAQKGRLMISEKHIRRFYYKRQKQLFGYIHKRGGKTMIHTDGDISELIPYYIDVGLDLLQCLEPAAGVNLIELNEKYGDKISWNGNIDVSRLLWKGTPDEVRKECERIISHVAPSHNLVFGPCTDIMAWHPVKNIVTLYETARAYDIKTGKFDYSHPLIKI